MQAPLRLGPVALERREDDARRADRDREDPRPHRADAHGARLLVARAADVARLADRRQPVERDAERAADLLAPAPAGDVEEERPRRLRGVDHALAGEAET